MAARTNKSKPFVTGLEAARERVRAARRPAVLTGAGVSAESGIPTFRGNGGMWRSRRAEDLATPEAFDSDPLLVWQWYEFRRNIVGMCEPNAAHRALANRFAHATLITQNVDGLHEQAGSKNVLRLHGSIWHVRCLECGLEEENRDVPLRRIPPLCRCGGLQRPAVVWFGEGLPRDVWDNAEKAARNADLLLVVGTSAVVYPAASLVPLAARAGATVVEINPGETPLSAAVDYSLRGPAGELLPRLLE
jgi:NAD-dependent deacetylase